VTLRIVRHLRLCTAVTAAAVLLVVSCATMRPDEATGADALAARVEAVLARRGLGQDALSVIDNILRHESPPAAPPASPPMVRELLARPPAAADAATLFYRAVPGALRRLVEEASAEPQAPSFRGRPAPIRELLDVYLGELVEAQRVLRSALRGPPIDAPAIFRRLGRGPPSPGELRGIAASTDQAALDRAANLFLNATARFIRVLRSGGGHIPFPEKAVRFESPIGVVSIGTRGNDVHGPDAAVIVDPGGDDVYERSPATEGAISVIFDLGGDDRYRGSDLVVHGLSAIVDFSGQDRYAMAGPGLGAAIAGAAVIVDFSGDDSYEAELFGEGAAAFGLGAIVDLRGDDTYRLRAGGQGFGLAGGVGLLWDRGGNDAYAAAGLADAFNRGGGVSRAQGAAFGLRTMLGGGIGILRDESGDDVYEAEMFAQGVGYYHGVGLLWDERGDDRYRAVRYAQGNGVHQAIGVLRDESGNDRYELAVGVGQGMGLDLAVGVLVDGAGDDRYQAPALAQGSATANGIGILSDGGGADRWQMNADLRSWGRAEWLRGLPSVGLLLYDPARAAFAREGKPVSPPQRSAEFGGPLGDSPIAHEPPGKPHCATAAPAAADAGLPLAESLRKLGPGFTGDGSADPATYADVQRRLRTGLRAVIAELPHDDFEVLYSFGEALRCALVAASAEDAASMWTEMERVLAAEPATPFAGAIAGALRGRPAGDTRRILPILERHPRCGVRAAALSLRSDLAADDASRASLVPLAQGALRSPCWRLQAAALSLLERLGAAPDANAPLPSFLRSDSGKDRSVRDPAAAARASGPSA
jgi:hypothetical protein